jgi:ribosome-associated protein
MTAVHTPASQKHDIPYDFVELSQKLMDFLDSQKAEHILLIDLRGKASFSDGMIIASCLSARHMLALSEKIKHLLHENGIRHVPIEGTQSGEWVLIDGGSIIIHLFRPETRELYNLERMWLKES